MRDVGDRGSSTLLAMLKSESATQLNNKTNRGLDEMGDEITAELIKHLTTTLQQHHHLLHEQRKENSDMFREFRVVIDRLKEAMTQDARQMADAVSKLELAMTQRNEQRVADYRALTTRVTLLSGGAALVVSAVVSGIVGAIVRFFSE